MRCKICGKRANTIANMSKHYRKKHPRSMKRKKKQPKRTVDIRRLKKGTVFKVKIV